VSFVNFVVPPAFFGKPVFESRRTRRSQRNQAKKARRFREGLQGTDFGLNLHPIPERFVTRKTGKTGFEQEVREETEKNALAESALPLILSVAARQTEKDPCRDRYPRQQDDGPKDESLQNFARETQERAKDIRCREWDRDKVNYDTAHQDKSLHTATVFADSFKSRSPVVVRLL
jgi:hypothetical protein